MNVPRIFLAGDAVSGTGPANVTKYYISRLPEGTLYQKFRNKFLRVPEIVFKTLSCDVAVYSGYSRQNLLGLKIAKLFNKPCAYIMHGCVEYENEINLEPDESMSRVERRTLEMADLIIAVSAGFAAWLKDYYPMHAGKIDHVYNGIDGRLFEEGTRGRDRDRHMIFSVGGGMPRKKIIHICEAVEKLRKQYDPEMYLCIVGDTGADSDAIDAYPFVKNLGIVSFDKTRHLYEKAALFVQNSCFETFGLAPVEALSCGCPVLLSKCIGALGIMGNVTDADAIEHCDDPDEIASKIRDLIENPNAARLAEGIDIESVSWERRCEELLAKLSDLVSKR